jgi:CelD/BcsL family acetyltransferase involved in cellulose biosynthesis
MTVPQMHAPAPRPGRFGPSDIRVTRSLDDLRALWPSASAPRDARFFAFQCAEVLEVWCDTIGRARNIEPAFVTVLGTSGHPALLLPLGIEQSNGVRVLQFLDSGLSDYNAPVVFPEAAGWNAEAAEAVWSLLLQALPPFDLAILEKMPDLIGDLRNPLAGLATAAHPESCHVATLFGPWDLFARERVPNFADSRRRRRKLEKLGKLQFEIAQTETQRLRFLEAMMRMKRRKFIETKGYDVFTDPGRGKFYEEATRELGSGLAQLSALLLDDRILAAHWGYVARDRFYHLMPSHEDGDWRQYAPGRLLNEWLMEWSLNNGLKFFDFGIGDEPYKFGYCDVHVPLRDAFRPISMKGGLYGNMRRVRTAAKVSLRDSKIGTTLIAARNRWRTLRLPHAR